MPQTLLIFDFGANEEAAQQARHRLEGWRQAFRLGDRVKFKFERQSASPAEGGQSGSPSPEEKKSKAGMNQKASDGEGEQTKEPASERLRVMVRLEFSSHEKLSYQRWLNRLGAEPPFQAAEKQVLQRGEEGFDGAVETFDALP